MPLTRLNLTKCIIIGDVRRIDKGEDPVRNIFGLSKELESLNEKEYDAERVCNILYRSNKTGYSTISPKLLEDIQKILIVEEDELIKYPIN